MSTASTTAALAAIHAERRRQDELHGGPKHDDKHTPFDWELMVRKRLERAEHARGTTSPDGWRAEMVTIAALAVAGIESLDRRMGMLAEQPDMVVLEIALCPDCGEYEALTTPDYEGGLTGICGACGVRVREVHYFRTMVPRDALGTCECRGGHDRRDAGSSDGEA